MHYPLSCKLSHTFTIHWIKWCQHASWSSLRVPHKLISLSYVRCSWIPLPLSSNAYSGNSNPFFIATSLRGPHTSVFIGCWVFACTMDITPHISIGSNYCLLSLYIIAPLPLLLPPPCSPPIHSPFRWWPLSRLRSSVGTHLISPRYNISSSLVHVLPYSLLFKYVAYWANNPKCSHLLIGHYLSSFKPQRIEVIPLPLHPSPSDLAPSRVPPDPCGQDCAWTGTPRTTCRGGADRFLSLQHGAWCRALSW